MSKPIYLFLGITGELVDPVRSERKVSKTDKKIKWRIKGDGIDSFKISAKDTSAPYPFTKPLDTDFQKKVTCKVADVCAHQEWAYNIIWRRDPNDPVGIDVDPIIVIDPTGGITPKKIILAALSAVVAACIPFAIKYIKRRLK